MFNVKKLGVVLGLSLVVFGLVGCSGNSGNNAPANNIANTAANAEADAGDKDLAKLGEISVISREDGSGTRGAFVEILGLMEDDVDNTTPEAIIQNSTNGVMTTVSTDPSAIGYSSLGSLNDTVKTLKVDGVEASAEDIINGTYAISRPFLLVTKGTPAEGSLEADFLKFAHSTQCQQIAEDEGYIKVEGAEEYQPADLSGSITVAGSTSVTPLMEKLAEEYKNLNPNANIEIQSTGSSAGIASTIDGSAQIGMSSRELKDEEKGELEELVLAKDGIAIIVNKENPLEDITKDQIKDIFGGKILDWEEL